MWLPETAVDHETLEVLAECGIQFTILAPWQAAEDNPDTTRAYRVQTGNGKQIAVFFYNRELSTRVSFDPSATMNADYFLSDCILPVFRKDETDQIVLIASDGELYGHHQPMRDKFLQYLTQKAPEGKNVKLTFPALWLEEHPPQEEIDIIDNTSWSCFHQLLRWSGSCACTPNGEWKFHLRKALNHIANQVDNIYQEVAGELVPDVWELRNQYISVLIGRHKIEDLLEELTGKKFGFREVRKLDLLLAAQFERQRMFMSCGWFFDDFDRIEPRNNVAYAAQAVFLTNLATGEDLSSDAITWLKPVQSWRSGLRGDVVFTQHYLRAREYQKGLIFGEKEEEEC
jgi:hypothetical protein